jgi:3-dehydroquinate dehydratase
MKDRSKGFLREELIDHDGEQFDYINELHGLLWRFVKTVNPGAFGSLSYHVEDALAIAEARKAFRDQLAETALSRLVAMREESKKHV